MNPMNSSNGLLELARPTWNRSARTTRHGGCTVREVLPIHLVIVGQWATGPHCNGFPGRRRSELASRRWWSRCGDQRIGRGRQRWREVERRRVDTQRHPYGCRPFRRPPAARLVLADRRNDLQLPGGRRCRLGRHRRCGRPTRRRRRQRRHPLAGKALVCITYAANGRRHPPPASRSPRPSGCGTFEPVAGLCQGRFQRDCDA